MESEVQILLQDEYNHVKNIHDCREQKQSNNKKKFNTFFKNIGVIFFFFYNRII
jgi:hypothetical protein